MADSTSDEFSKTLERLLGEKIGQLVEQIRTEERAAAQEHIEFLENELAKAHAEIARLNRELGQG